MQLLWKRSCPAMSQEVKVATWPTWLCPRLQPTRLSKSERPSRLHHSLTRWSRHTPSAQSAFLSFVAKSTAQQSPSHRVGQLLSRYKSGPLPKAFKILPTIPVWPAILELTEPDKWTPHAVYAATKIFASNLDPKNSQRFYRDVLLPHIREEIQENKKLSVHTYMAIKKAMYKPAAFFKGVLFPLCEVRGGVFPPSKI